jgi:type II secretory pathway pseudopilin PulG
MLLAVLFMMAIMVITALAVAPAFLQQAKRDREEEMIHRGTEYARAIKKYYKKFGRYPANLEQLDNTNQIRFLRRRYKDPLSKDGQWKLLHAGDVQALAGLTGVGVAGLQQLAQGGLQGANALNSTASGLGGLTGTDQGANTAQTGTQVSPAQQSGLLGGPQLGGAQPGGGTSAFAAGGSGGAAGQSGFSLGPGPGQTGGVGGTQGPGQGTTGQAGSNNTIFGDTGVGGQTFGGGAIVGVASKSKDPTIRVFNKKTKYDEWQFIYSPMMDRQNTLLRGPYNGQTLATSGQFGTPAGQLNQGNQTGVGQQPGGLGQQNPQPNQQQNQSLTPPAQFPPDQTQPQ